MPLIDDLARTLSQASGRRTLLGALIAAAALPAGEGAAKKKRKKRRKKKGNSCAWPCDPDAFEIYIADACASSSISEKSCLGGAKRCLLQYLYLYAQGNREAFREYTLNCIAAWD